MTKKINISWGYAAACLLSFCIFSTAFANVKMVKIGTVDLPQVKQLTSIGLTGGAVAGGFDGLIESGGSLAVTYIDNGGGTVTGRFAGNIEHVSWRSVYHLNKPGQNNDEFMAQFDVSMQWKDVNGYHYDLEMSGPSKIDKAGIDKFLLTGGLDDDDHYEFFSGTLLTNNPDYRHHNFKSIVWETIAESVNPDGTFHIKADLYLLRDK